jgi:hypothetical protein
VRLCAAFKVEVAAMAKKTKPNFSPFGNKKSGKQKTIFDDLFAPSKNFNKPKDHHDSRKGGGGNNTGKPRR